ncbi:MAG: LamG domain-containing protein, partial [Fuerstiella sp.]|nr:LamG domain-containing protein [Fuerstiella sp.]
CDGQWHSVAAQFDGSQVLLFVDGKQVMQQDVAPVELDNTTSGPLTIGALASEQLGCDGFIDDVVIKNGAESGAAMGHWNFNAKSVSNVVDRSELAQQTVYIRTRLEKEYLDKWTPKSRQDSRFPYENETDTDWIDSRFSQMDTGPIFCNSIRVPGRGVVPKAIARRD